ncbi:MAG: PEP-utilizing enzyme [bacterium]
MKHTEVLKNDWKQFSLRQRMSPFPNYMSMETISKEMKQVVGAAYKQVLLIYRENLQYAFLSGSEYDRVGKYILNKTKKDSQLFHRLVQKDNKYGRELLKFVKAQAKKDLKKQTGPQLARTHAQFEKLYKRVYRHYFPIFALDGVFMKYMRSYIEAKSLSDERVGEYLNTLITEPRAMVAKQEERASLRLAVSIDNNQKWRTAVLKPKVAQSIKTITKIPALKKRIQEHEKKYFWVTRDYEDPVLTFNKIVGRLRKQLKANPQAKLNEIEQTWRILPKERQATQSALGMDQVHIKLCRSAREGAHLKELRKTFVSQALFYYDPILKEIAHRGSLTMRQVRHLTTNDIKDMLCRQADFRKEAAARVKSMVLYIVNGRAKVLSGKSADLVYQAVYKVQADVKVIKGLSASPGKAKGKVRLIMNPQEGSKLKQGEILVTVQAVPSFAPFIGRAAAMVAEGGTALTSHPATLAREAKIPCVTAAKMATQLLKDGDAVEVDGDKGIVKRL